MRRVIPLLLATAVLLPVRAAHADPYVLGNLGNFAIYGWGTGFTEQYQPGKITVNGNVGIGQGGDLLMGGSGQTITGKVYFADAATSTNVSTTGTNSINGQASCSTSCITSSRIVGSDAAALNAATDAVNMYAAVAGLAPSQTLAGLNSSLTLNSSGGGANTTVVKVNGDVNLSAGHIITLTGDASDFFIFNITGGLSGSSGGGIVLNGVSSDHVLFNFLCSPACTSTANANASDITFSGSFTGSGIILGLNRNITEDTPGGGWSGRYISEGNTTIKLFSEANITSPPPTTTTPEPGTMVLLASGLAGMGGFVSRKRKARAMA